MSALPAEAGDGAYDEPATAPPATPGPTRAPVRARRPGLHVVPAVRRSRAPLAPFVTVLAAFLVLGLAALLGLNTVLAQDAFRIHDLEQSNARLAEREQALSRELTALQSPAALAERAEALGMLPSSSPLFLRLPDGAVLGAAPKGEQGSADPDALAAVEAAEAEARGTGEGTASGEGSATTEATGSAEESEAEEQTGSAEETATGERASSDEAQETAETDGQADEQDDGEDAA